MHLTQVLADGSNTEEQGHQRALRHAEGTLLRPACSGSTCRVQTSIAAVQAKLAKLRRELLEPGSGTGAGGGGKGEGFDVSHYHFVLWNVE